MVCFPDTLSGTDVVELHLYLQISTAPTLLDFLAGRWMVDNTQFHERIPMEYVSGRIPITPLYLKARLLPTEKPIQIDPPKGSRIDDFVLFCNGTTVPGHQTHYDYVVGNAMSEFRIALPWDDPESPVTLTLITSDGYVLGPYTDQYDSTADGKIPPNITAAQPLAGEWGIDVSGSEDHLHHQPYQIHVRKY